VQARDSNFILGSIGSGDATLTINGTAVPVQPNGSFLAWLPVPTPDAPMYIVTATAGNDTARLVRRVRVPPPRVSLANEAPLAIDSSSLTPRGARTLPPGEPVRVSVRAPQNATVEVQLAGGRQIPLVNLALNGSDPFLWATDVPAGDLEEPGTIIVARGTDTLRFSLGPVTRLDPGSGPQYVVLAGTPPTVPDTDFVITARPVPRGTYKWLLFPGTVVEMTGRVLDQVRVRLDAALEVWVNESDVRMLPAGASALRRVASNARLSPAAEWVDFTVPVGDRPPFYVQVGERRLSLTLYGVQADADIVSYAGNDSLVRRVTWVQESRDRARFDLELSHEPFGYLVLWQRGSLVLRVRRPPAIDPASPLRGLTIAVNAGHPPAGATGPTGLYEAVPTLAISQRVASMLEAKGARVIMVRTTAEPMALAIRPVVARRANAQAFVSIHLNALPDGINPFTAQGTGTYYFHPQSIALARAVQRGLVQHMGLRTVGVFYDNLSDLRQPWFPSVLTEGAFIILPEMESALRTPEFQTRYAAGVVAGLESYFGALGGGGRSR
jgi:N-acetylmuramoyl-L-alanine amidase